MKTYAVTTRTASMRAFHLRTRSARSATIPRADRRHQAGHRVCPERRDADAHEDRYHRDLDHCTRRPGMLGQEVWGLEHERVRGSPKTMNGPEFGEFSLSVATDTSPASNDQ
jgi:hypothetical protein